MGQMRTLRRKQGIRASKKPKPGLPFAHQRALWSSRALGLEGFLHFTKGYRVRHFGAAH